MYDKGNLEISKFQRNMDITNRAKTEEAIKVSGELSDEGVPSPVKDRQYLDIWAPRVGISAS